MVSDKQRDYSLITDYDSRLLVVHAIKAGSFGFAQDDKSLLRFVILSPPAFLNPGVSPTPAIPWDPPRSARSQQSSVWQPSPKAPRVSALSRMIRIQDSHRCSRTYCNRQLFRC